MCHTYHNPRNQLPFPFQVKKNKKQNKTKNKKNKKTKKNQKQELRMRIFLGYHMDWKDRNVTYIYIYTTTYHNQVFHTGQLKKEDIP